MREFADGSRIAGLKTPSKVLYTAFALLTLAGLFSSVMLYHEIVRFEAHATPRQLADRLVEHHRPSSRDTTLGAPLDGSEPEPQPQRSTYQRLLTVTHAHLFTVPILLLVSGHLFLLTGFRPPFKLGFVTFAACGVALHLAAPWAVYLWGAPAAWAYPITLASFLAAFGALLGLALWDMWRPRGGRTKR
jgi:hypothetical protein